MSNDLDEDLQGLLRALIVLVAGFGGVSVLLSLLGSGTAEHPLP